MAEVGRPAHYTDGNYPLSEMLYCLKEDFRTERDMCDYIEKHITLFCKDCLNVEYQSHKREYPLSDIAKVKGNKRIDFLIITTDNERIGVECKKPTYPCEVSNCLGQVLTYMTVFEQVGKPFQRMVIVSTKVEPSLVFTIEKFNLPVVFIGFDKDKFITPLIVGGCHG